MQSVGLAVCPKAGTTLLELDARKIHHKLPGTGNIAAFLRAIEIRVLRLDTRLERNQLVEIVLLLLHVGPELRNPVPARGNAIAWAKQRLVAEMLHDDGLHRFCAGIRFRPGERACSIEYRYCELFYSNVVSNYLRGRPKARDHRALFVLAPRVGLSLSALSLLPLAVSQFNLDAVVPTSILVALCMGICGWYAVHTIGSVHHDREHRDKLLSDSSKEHEALAYRPEVDPNAVIKLAADGSVMYSNPASRISAHLKSVA